LEAETASGNLLQWKGRDKPVVGTATQDRVQLTGCADGHNLEISTETGMDYDGMIKCRLVGSGANSPPGPEDDHGQYSRSSAVAPADHRQRGQLYPLDDSPARLSPDCPAIVDLGCELLKTGCSKLEYI